MNPERLMIKKHEAVNVQVHNKINGNFRRISKGKNMFRSYSTLQYIRNIGLK